MRQDDSNEDIKSLKVPRSIIFKKCNFTIGKLYFLRLGGSQEEYERFRKAPKRHLKSFKTSKERVPKMEPKTISVWTIFGVEMDPEMEPPKKWKLDQKWNRNWKCIRCIEMGVENANTVNCRCRCRYKSCQINKRKESICIHWWFDINIFEFYSWYINRLIVLYIYIYMYDLTYFKLHF